MKRKILISAATILFLFSTTGLPIFSHYCEILGRKTLNECEVCSVEEEITSSCCSEDILEYQMQLTAAETNCCVEEFDYKKVEDNLYQNVKHGFSTFQIVVSVLDSNSLEEEKSETNSLINNFDLPPLKFGKQLLQTIHQLKIDLPLC